VHSREDRGVLVEGAVGEGVELVRNTAERVRSGRARVHVLSWCGRAVSSTLAQPGCRGRDGSTEASDGQWRPATRPIRFVVQVDGTPSRVVLNGTSIPRAQTQPSTGTTWSLDGRGFVVVETADTFGAMTLEIAR